MWMVRAGEGGRLIDDFRDKSLVAVGWNDLGDLTTLTDKDKINEVYIQNYPKDSKMKAASQIGQIHRFRNEIKVNAGIVSYDPTKRTYLIGTVRSEYKYGPDIVEFHNYREVRWVGEVSRDKLSVSTKNTLGAISTLFLLSNKASQELEAMLSGKDFIFSSTDETEITEEKDLIKDTEARSHEFIKDRVSKLDWDQLQELVASLLRAMGYKTQVSPAGPDRGKDIVASPDGFGFEQPRIIVEVKHRQESIGAPAIRSFLGGRHKDDKGLYVSTGGFSKDAYYEADRAHIPLTLMKLDDLVDTIVEYYENMDIEGRTLIPLVKIYWPGG